MTSHSLINTPITTPVALLIFNRPDTTARVFGAIRNARPPILLVVADGPRAGNPDDARMCAAARALIENIDWPCRVLKNFSDVNLGCRQRVSSGLDWVFSMVEEAIILEDDCLPHPTFFHYCDELLARYRDDTRIMHISGNNFRINRSHNPYSYYFSRYNHIWGWASWRRAWKFYDVTMKLWPEIRNDKRLFDVFSDRASTRFWSSMFDRAYRGEINTWDFQWTFACWVQSGSSILPAKTLVSNIGFDSGATHTKSSSGRLATLDLEEMPFPLAHPQYVIRDAQADLSMERDVYRSGLWRRLRSRIRRIAGPGELS